MLNSRVLVTSGQIAVGKNAIKLTYVDDTGS